MKKTETLLMFANSEHDANMLYATGLFVPDPFIFIHVGGKPMLVMSDLEIDRAKVTAPHCQIVSLSDCQKKLRDQGQQRPRTPDIIADILRGKKIRRVTVPENFPLGLARELEKLGVTVSPREGTFFLQREIKSADEVKKLSAALKMAEVGMAAAMRALKNSKIVAGRKLIYRNAPLTSERLRAVIGCAILEAGGVASGTIVAGGIQACDPHERGHGQLRAHEAIIIDIFPRAQATGYFGDITRTVVRGKANDAIRKLYNTVFEGQKIAFKKFRHGANTSAIHTAVNDYFEAQGYKTGKQDGRMQGFFHGTGHGLGLEIHEAPRVGATSLGELKAGQVVTNEPGLYYPAIGGVRLEDVVAVTKTGGKNLTSFEKVLEI
jgi:Xaa-Pro aminopeptidase